MSVNVWTEQVVNKNECRILGVLKWNMGFKEVLYAAGYTVSAS
jgi:hypothetical protein